MTKGDISKWLYQSRMNISCIQAEADLLIGSNAAKMLEPWEIINSHENGQCAIRTALRCVINGPLHSYEQHDGIRLNFRFGQKDFYVKVGKLLCEFRQDFSEKRWERIVRGVNWLLAKVLEALHGKKTFVYSVRLQTR